MPILALNTLSAKYLSKSDGTAQPRQHGNDDAKNVEMGCLGYSFVAIGVYYCSALDRFGQFEHGIQDPLVDSAGRAWRLVSSDLVNWMAGMIDKAFSSDTVSDVDLGVAVLKFYRVRDRLEQEIQNHERASAIDSGNVRRQDVQRDLTGTQSPGTDSGITAGTGEKRHGDPLESRNAGGLAKNTTGGRPIGVASHSEGGQHPPGGAGGRLWAAGAGGEGRGEASATVAAIAGGRP